jgi:hypothetical protein
VLLDFSNQFVELVQTERLDIRECLVFGVTSKLLVYDLLEESQLVGSVGLSERGFKLFDVIIEFKSLLELLRRDVLGQVKRTEDLLASFDVLQPLHFSVQIYFLVD